MKHLTRSILFGVAVCSLGYVLIGCTQYIEEETTISPVGAGPITPARPFNPSGTNQAAQAASSFSPYIGKPLSGADKPITEEVYAASIAGFKESYAVQGYPRIAVYFNRALSDEVREWMTARREIVTGKGENVTVGQGGGATVVTDDGIVVTPGAEIKAEGAEDTERGVSTYEQRHMEQQMREDPREQWKWRFEDSFLQPFLKAGAKTVDRATILRLVAATSGKQGDPYSLNTIKKVEMDALAQYADIYVELLVTRDATSPTGYAFRALAKGTKDGIIVGSVAKGGRDYRYDKAYEAYATSSGYTLTKGSPALILEGVSEELAIDLMNSMANSWKSRP